MSVRAVQLGDLLAKSESWITPRPEAEYKEVTVRLWGKGLVLRGKKLGSEFGAGRRLEVRSGQFIVSRIDARHGAFGIAPEALDGAVVSNDFPAHIPDSARIHPDYLHWLSKTHGFVDACKRASEGTTNRVRLKEDQFKRIAINLPSLDEQQRIVKEIEFFSEKIAQANKLRTEIQTDTRALLRSAFADLIDSVPYRPMAEVAPIVRRPVSIEPEKEYSEISVRSFHKGTIFKCASSGLDISHKRMYWIEPGDLIFSNIMAWEGAIAVAQPEDEGRIGVHRFITCVPVSGIATSYFLYAYFETNEGFSKIVGASPATIARNRTLSVKKLENIEVPVPDYDKQLRFNGLQTKVAAIRKAQADNQIELDALMPSILDRAFAGVL